MVITMKNSKINILFSRPKELLADACSVLPSTRFNVVPCPMINIEQIETKDEIPKILNDLNAFDYLIFTSRYAVIATMNHLKVLGIRTSDLQRLTICSIGPMVSAQLSKFNLNTQLMPQTYTAASLCELLPSIRKESKKILYPRGNYSLGVVEQVMSRKGYKVVAPVVYSTKLRDLDNEIKCISQASPLDCIALTSPSSAKSFAHALANNGNNSLTEYLVSAIGPTTKKACDEMGLPVHIMPKEYTVQSMARAIYRHYQKFPKFMYSHPHIHSTLH